MRDLRSWLFCTECRSMRINVVGGTGSVCPNGHGRLWPRILAKHKKAYKVSLLPEATQVKKRGRVWTVAGQSCLIAKKGNLAAIPARVQRGGKWIERRFIRILEATDDSSRTVPYEVSEVQEAGVQG